MQAYLDNNATTRPHPAVLEAMVQALGDGFGNPSSAHATGEWAARAVAEARARTAALLRCRETEVVFTACATESMNAAIRGALDAARPGTRRRLVITAVEHEAVFEIANFVARHHDVDVEIVGVDEAGRLDMAHLEEALDTPTTVLSLMLVNNETGMILPVKEAAELARSRGASVHVDAVQAVGKLELDAHDLSVDFLSLSGHKFHGPKGAGVLFVRRGARFVPFMVGAGQEGGRRSGTENVPGIVGLGAAAAHMSRDISERRARLADLSGRIEERLLGMPDTRLNGASDGRVPGVVSLSFKGIEGAAIVLTAAREGVAISAGSACSSAQSEGSHVLEAMRTPLDFLHGSIRMSCCETTTTEEVHHALDVVGRAVEYLRAMNP